MSPFRLAIMQIDDVRTSGATAYSPSCIPSGEMIYGPDAVVDPDTGEVKDIGHVVGSLILEVNEGAVHRMNTLIFAILAKELVRLDQIIGSGTGERRV
jgi:hypothetical protein